MQDREIFIGISPEQEEIPPDNLGLAQFTALPCPVEKAINKIVETHSLDRNDHRVSTVLNIVRNLMLEYPTNQFTGALADNHIGNIRKGRWHVYPQIKESSNLSESQNSV